LIGALQHWGIPASRMDEYHAGIENGGILMGVKPHSDEMRTTSSSSGESITRVRCTPKPQLPRLPVTTPAHSSCCCVLKLSSLASALVARESIASARTSRCSSVCWECGWPELAAFGDAGLRRMRRRG
jgi:hypothetical protein